MSVQKKRNNGPISVMEPAKIGFHQTRILHLTSVRIRMWIYYANYFQTVLPNNSLE